VDDSAVACDYARHNADAAGLGHLVDVRRRRVEDAVEAEERFALVLADPPWVPSDETDRYPDDVPEAIDGGPDGLDAARACVRAAAPHLVPGGSVLLQLGSRAQVRRLGGELADLTVTEVRDGDGGVVARLVRS
jgi:methylase of polypeptide subunit release factors